MEELFTLIIGFVIMFGLFVALRRVSWWYWGIDQLLRSQKKQEMILEQMLLNNAGQLPKVKVKQLATNEIVEMSMDGFVDLLIKYPGKFERVY